MDTQAINEMGRRINRDKMIAAEMGNLTAAHFVLCNAETHLYLKAIGPLGDPQHDPGDAEAMAIIARCILSLEAYGANADY
jgi:hypothetical protein